MQKTYTLRSSLNPLPLSSYEFKKIWNPSWFQGSREKNNYFEGWYFKNASRDGKHCWSFIPGVSLVGDNAHSFVQAINGTTGETFYFTYKLEEFSFSNKGFSINVGPNTFSNHRFELDISKGENRFVGQVQIFDPVTFPTRFTRPGIMGWYRYMPFMECYHGVVSLDHELAGTLIINGREINLDEGRGYIEKDWGSSMPKAWIWMQTNHFDQQKTSFMLSVARIPWIGKTFTGFLGFFLHEGKIISFATYTGAKIVKLEYTERETQIEIKTPEYILKIHGIQSASDNQKHGKGSLKAPVLGNMDRVIHESIDAEILLEVSDTKGNPVFNGRGNHAGLEMVGDLQLLKG